MPELLTRAECEAIFGQVVAAARAVGFLGTHRLLGRKPLGVLRSE